MQGGCGALTFRSALRPSKTGVNALLERESIGDLAERVGFELTVRLLIIRFAIALRPVAGCLTILFSWCSAQRRRQADRSCRRTAESKSSCDFNDIRVRSFIRNGAPIELR